MADEPQIYPTGIPCDVQAKLDLTADLSRWAYRLFLPVDQAKEEARVILAKIPPGDGFEKDHSITQFKVVSNHSHTFVSNFEQPAFIRSMASLVEDEWTRESDGKRKRRIVLAFRGTGFNPDGPWIPQYSWGEADDHGLFPSFLVALVYAYLSAWMVPGLALGDAFQDVRFFRASLVRGAAPNRLITKDQLDDLVDPETRWRTAAFLVVLALFICPLWIPFLLPIVVIVLPLIRLIYYLGLWVWNKTSPSALFYYGLPFPFEPLEWIYYEVGDLFAGGHAPPLDTKLGQVHLGFWALFNSPDGYGGYVASAPSAPGTPADKTVDAKPGGTIALVGDRIQDAIDNKIEVELFITGHSLGGAVSTIAASDIANRMDSKTPIDSLSRFEKCPIYHLTFASPMVGDEKFVEVFADSFPTDWATATAKERFSVAVKRDTSKAAGDPVPKVPMSLVPAPVWKHVGIPVVLEGVAWEENVYGLSQRVAPLALHDISGYSFLIRDKRQHVAGQPPIPPHPGVPWNLSKPAPVFIGELLFGLLKYAVVVVINHLRFAADLFGKRGWELLRATVLWVIDLIKALIGMLIAVKGGAEGLASQ